MALDSFAQGCIAREGILREHLKTKHTHTTSFMSWESKNMQLANRWSRGATDRCDQPVFDLCACLTCIIAQIWHARQRIQNSLPLTLARNSFVTSTSLTSFFTPYFERDASTNRPVILQQHTHTFTHPHTRIHTRTRTPHRTCRNLSHALIVHHPNLQNLPGSMQHYLPNLARVRPTSHVPAAQC